MKPLMLGMCLALALVGCKEEQDPAEALYKNAVKYAEKGQFDQTIKTLQLISVNYEDSEYAVKAANEITQYEELVAVAKANQKRNIQQKFSRIHLALENYKARFLVYPLTPGDLEKLPRLVVPEWEDAWGHQIFYAPTYSKPDLPKHLPDGYALASFGEDGLPGGEGAKSDYFYKDGREVGQVTE